jgi:hypothetical protein
MKLATGESIVTLLEKMDLDMGVATLIHPHSIELNAINGANMLWIDDWLPYTSDDRIVITIKDIITVVNPTGNVIRIFNQLVERKMARSMPPDHALMLKNLETTVAN